MRVRLGVRTVVGKYDHALIILEDMASGDTWVSEGGPHGVWLKGGVKKRVIDEELNLDEEVCRTSNTSDNVVAKFKTYAKQTEVVGYEAIPQGGGNSNSWAHEQLWADGHHAFSPYTSEYVDSGRWLPGWFDNPWRGYHP